MRSLLPAPALLALLLAACGNDTPPAQQAAAPPAPPQKTKTVLDDQLKAIDKAKAVQDTVDQEKAKADEKLKEAGG